MALAFQNGVVYYNSDFERFISDDLATVCNNLVNFGPLTLEFNRGKYVYLLVDQQFGYVRLAAPLLDHAGIRTEFRGAIRTRGRNCYAVRATG